MASPSVGELSPEFCCTDSKTFELLKHIQREIQGYAPFVLPLVLLLGFGVVFAAASLGGSMLGFDDHPGQLYRVWHVMTYGPAPWAWDRGWWAGYPELQFYPPGFAYLGALLAWPTTGVLEIGTVYQTLLWLAYLLPGVTTYVVLARLTGSGWSALPAAFVALTLSAGLGSGVGGGGPTGMDRARPASAARPPLLWLPPCRAVLRSPARRGRGRRLRFPPRPTPGAGGAAGMVVPPGGRRNDRARSPGAGAARNPLAAGRSRRRRRVDRAGPRGRRGSGAAGATPRRDAVHAAPGPLPSRSRARARRHRRLRAALAERRDADAPPRRRRLAVPILDRPRPAAAGFLELARPAAGGAPFIRPVGRTPGLRRQLVAAAQPRDRADAGRGRPRHRARHAHASGAHRRPPLPRRRPPRPAP